LTLHFSPSFLNFLQIKSAFLCPAISNLRSKKVFSSSGFQDLSTEKENSPSVFRNLSTKRVFPSSVFQDLSTEKEDSSSIVKNLSTNFPGTGMEKAFSRLFSFLPLSLSFVVIRRLVKFFAEKIEKNIVQVTLNVLSSR